MTERMRAGGDGKHFIFGKWFVMSFILTLVLSPFLLYADQCPQPRNTKRAPAEYYQKENPLPADPENILAGKILFEEKAKPLPCMQCHGIEGTGNGPLAFGLNPAPRNFTCAQTIKGVPDGQLFWIIQNGSKGTGMPAFNKLEEEEIWQLILYIRKLSLTRMVEFRQRSSNRNQKTLHVVNKFTLHEGASLRAGREGGEQTILSAPPISLR